MSIAKRKLGRTGLDVTVLGFGSAPLGDIYKVLDDATAIATVEAAAQAGVTLFDAAPLYGQGMAEHRVGTALRRQPPGSFVLSSKVGRLLMPAPAGAPRPRATWAACRSMWCTTTPTTARCARTRRRCSASGCPRSTFC